MEERTARRPSPSAWKRSPAARSAGARRNGHRQHHHRGGDLSRALWRRGRGLGRPRHRRRRCGAQRKTAAVRARSRCTSDHLADPLEVLRRLGGREIAAMAGAILAARVERMPVLLDGFVVCAAAAILHALDPRASTIASPAMSRPKARMGESWPASARSRCSISACGSAKAPARRSPSASSRRRSPATTTWRPSPQPASPARNSRKPEA